MKKQYVIALAGNPNTGKSTIFNALTGLNQHTGNWAGKTVENAEGFFKHKNVQFKLVDLPGIYSILSDTAEERCAKNFICDKKPDMVLVVADATCLERNLNLCIQIIGLTKNVVLCLNLMDEAKKKKMEIDIEKLSKSLGIPVVPASARSGVGIYDIKEKAFEIVSGQIENSPIDVELGGLKFDEACLKTISIASCAAEKAIIKDKKDDLQTAADKIILSKKFGIPIIILVLGIIFWITIFGANYPSSLLMKLFSEAEKTLKISMEWAPGWLSGILIDGMFKTSGWVISVMLPPMAVFFPLFTFLEDIGFLPRIAFNLDGLFKKAGAHGKQSLTMMMGFGCNAAGVTACRIIDTPRERLIATITNNFVPCNGRFPTIILIASVFLTGGDGFAAGMFVLLMIVVSVLITLVASKILSSTALKGIPSSFALELPPYRRPQILKIIVRSLLDRTLFVLGRAICVAVPCGALIWIMQNVTIGEISLLTYFSEFLDPLGTVMGLNGIILAAFILGLPANEIVIPILIMYYSQSGSLMELSTNAEIHSLFAQNGWTFVTALCVVVFSLNHFPCATTLLTIKKETGSLKWAALSFVFPTLVGILICTAINFIYKFASIWIF